MHRLTTLVSLITVLLFGGGLAGQPARAADAATPMRFSASVKGSGPDVILIPGLASSGAVWDDTVRRLSGRYRLHVIQVAGFAGLAPGPNAEGPVIAPVVEALHAYVAAHHLGHPAVIGHSMGGLIGLMLAQAHPDDVGRLMVVDALPFYSSIFGPGVTAATAEPFAAQARDAILAMPAEAYVAAEAQTAARLSKSPEGRASVEAWGLASDRSVAARATYDDMTTDVRPGLTAIKCPVVVVYAWDAASGPAERTDALYASNYANLPGKRLVRVEDTFHFIPLDQPDAFSRQVEDFLRP